MSSQAVRQPGREAGRQGGRQAARQGGRDRIIDNYLLI